MASLLKFIRLKYLKLLIPISALALLCHVARIQLIELDISLASAYLKELSLSKIIVIFATALLAVSSMLLYDLVLHKMFSLPVTRTKLLKISWIANTFNNLFGMGGLTGAGVRTYLFRKYGVSTSMSIYSAFLVTLATGSGLGFLGLLSLVNVLPVSILFSQHFLLYALIIGSSLYFICYHLLVYYNSYTKQFTANLRKQKLAISIKLFLASLLEWLTAGMLFYTITRMMEIEIPFLFLLGLFTIAALAGLISMIPGGLGSFDLTIMIGFDLVGIDPELGLATLIIYRLFYFVLPWISGLLLASTLVLPKRKQMLTQAQSIWNTLCEQINGRTYIGEKTYVNSAPLVVIIFATIFLMFTPLGLIKAFFFRDLFIMVSTAMFIQRY